jgi:uncharacterized protein
MNKDYSLKKTPANEVRKLQYARDDAWIEDFLQRVQVVHIATHWDDQPFITPTLFCYDKEQRQIYFHNNVVGRVRANIERHPEVCLEASQMGNLLPSNAALNFSVQYESVVVFGKARILEDEAERTRVLYRLIEKYFPGMQPGEHYRPIQMEELARTMVFAVHIESWSGKRNWKEQAGQVDDWPKLPGLG